MLASAESIARKKMIEGDSLYVENINGDENQITVFCSGCTSMNILCLYIKPKHTSFLTIKLLCCPYRIGMVSARRIAKCEYFSTHSRYQAGRKNTKLDKDAGENFK